MPNGGRNAVIGLVVGFALFSGLGKNPLQAFYVFFVKPVELAALARAIGRAAAPVSSKNVFDFLRTLRENGPMVRMCAVESQRSPDMLAWHLQRIEEEAQAIIGQAFSTH